MPTVVQDHPDCDTAMLELVRIKHCKTPREQVKYAIQMALAWATDEHLHEMFRRSFYTPSSFRACVFNQTDFERLTDLVWSITSERTWSLASRHSVPPDCYASILLEANDRRVSDSVELMRHHWRFALWLEHLRAHSLDPVADTFWNDCHFLRSTLVRLIFHLFERDNWSTAYH